MTREYESRRVWKHLLQREIGGRKKCVSVSVSENLSARKSESVTVKCGRREKGASWWIDRREGKMRPAAVRKLGWAEEARFREGFPTEMAVGKNSHFRMKILLFLFWCMY